MVQLFFRGRRGITNRDVGANVAGQIAPRRARTQDPKDAVEHAAVIYTLHAVRLVRQERLDGGPYVGDLIIPL